MLICRFTTADSVDSDEFRTAIAAALDEAMRVGATRVGKLDAYRLFAGRRAETEGQYQLEIEGLMVFPPGIKAALESAGAENISAGEYAEVLRSSSSA